MTSIPSQEWKTLETAAAELWDKIVADGSPRAKKVVQILRDYNALMEKAGSPYRY